MQFQRRKREKNRRTAENGHGTHTETRTAAPGAGQATGQDNEEKLEADKMNAENNLNSYAGKDDQEKADNRTWFHETYETIWPNKLEMEDLKGRHMTIDQSLRLLGIKIQTIEQCRAFFNDETREEMMKVYRRLNNVELSSMMKQGKR